MSFIDSYKHLEKLCGEVLNDDRRVSAYIDEMLNKPYGSYLVKGWDDDLKKLKHYRWVRNKIAHEPDCTEQNMCEPNDYRWLDNFYSRIMNGTDPLSLYSQAIKTRRSPKSAQKTPTEHSKYKQQDTAYKKPSQKFAGCMAFSVGILIIAAAIILISISL